MKKLATTTIVLFSIPLSASKLLAEEYICSYIYNDNSMTVVFDRQSKQLFEQVNHDGIRKPVRVLFENQIFLILGNLTKYTFKGTTFSGYKVTFIDKNIEQFQTYSITEPKHKELKSNLNSGDCMVR